MTNGGSDIYWCQCTWNTKCKVWWYVYQMLIALINYKCPTSFDSCIKKAQQMICNCIISNISTLVLCLYLTYIDYTLHNLYLHLPLSFRPSVIPSLYHSLPLTPLSFPPSHSSVIPSLSFLCHSLPLTPLIIMLCPSHSSPITPLSLPDQTFFISTIYLFYLR